MSGGGCVTSVHKCPSNYRVYWHDIHSHQMINPSDFGDALTLHDVAQ